MIVQDVDSWGRIAKVRTEVCAPFYADQAQALASGATRPMLAHGLGRSYGDACLAGGGVMLRTTGLDRFVTADWDSGVVRAEAGLSLDALLRVCVPRGWFLPVTPGTKFVTLGGAVAHDVHGKNHEHAGTFGCHVRRLALARSNGEVLELGPDDTSGLFQATIGGLGLTGFILWVELALKRIASTDIEVETLAITDLDHFFRLAEDSSGWEYTVAWTDCLARGAALGRGLFMRGRHVERGRLATHRGARLSVPFDAPSWLLNAYTVRLFNLAYRHRAWAMGKRVWHYDPFFYPLDSVAGWNRLYGRRGFFQHQSVVPQATAPAAMQRLLSLTGEYQQGSFLIVLKTFGKVASPGVMSFPQEGATLAVDLPNRGASTRKLLDAMTDVTVTAGGRIYPAKDATMSSQAFKAGFPRWRELEASRDPMFNSDLWRRLMQ